MACMQLRFDVGESLDALAERVKQAFDNGGQQVYVECESPDFAECAMSNDIFDDGVRQSRLADAIFFAFEAAGVSLPLRMSIQRKPGVPGNVPYSAALVYEKP